MIVTTQVNPYGPTYMGYGRARGYGQPVKFTAPYYGYHRYGDWQTDAQGWIDAGLNTVKTVLPIATTITGGNNTGSSGVPINNPVNPNQYYASPVSHPVPTWVWIAGGLAVAGGAVFFLAK